MKKNKEKQSKFALYMLNRSLRKQDTRTLELIIDISNRIIEERHEDDF